MPLPMIDGDLVAGTLVRLHMPDHVGGTYRFNGVWRRDTRPARPPRGCWTSSWNWARRTANSKGWATSSTGQPRQHDIALPRHCERSEAIQGTT
jgi:hypothetical protein